MVVQDGADCAPDAPGGADGANGTTRAEDAPEESQYKQAQRELLVDGRAFGARVRQLRRAKGWSLRRLGRASGVPHTTVDALERGESDNPSPVTTLALARTFGYGSPGALMAQTDEHPVGDAEAAGAMTFDKVVELALRGVLAALEGHRRRATTVVAVGAGVVVLGDDAEPRVTTAVAVPEPPPPAAAGGEPAG